MASPLTLILKVTLTPPDWLISDLGRRRSPPSERVGNVSKAINDRQDGTDTGLESDLEEPLLWTEPKGVGGHGTPLNATQDAREGGRARPPLHTPHMETAAPPPPPPQV